MVARRARREHHAEVVDFSGGWAAVRRAGPDDAAGVARVHAGAWRVAYRGVVADDYLDAIDEGQWARRWRAALERPERERGPVFVATRGGGGRVIGFSASGRARDEDLRAAGHFEVYALYLEPAAWGSGVAGELLGAALDAVPPGAPGVALWVLADNPRARAFYERNGFSMDGMSKVESIGGGELVELRYLRDHRRAHSGRGSSTNVTR